LNELATLDSIMTRNKEKAVRNIDVKTFSAIQKSGWVEIDSWPIADHLLKHPNVIAGVTSSRQTSWFGWVSGATVVQPGWKGWKLCS